MELLVFCFVLLTFIIFNRRRYLSQMNDSEVGRDTVLLEASAAFSIAFAFQGNLLVTLFLLCLVVIYILSLEYNLHKHKEIISKVQEIIKKSEGSSNE